MDGGEQAPDQLRDVDLRLDTSQSCAEYYLKEGTPPWPSGISAYTETVQAAWVKYYSLIVLP